MMTRHLNAREGTFAAGWNAACHGLALRPNGTADEREGYEACMRYPARDRVIFNQGPAFGAVVEVPDRSIAA